MENTQHLTETDSKMQSLEFSNGEVKSYFSLPKNQISTRQQSSQYSLFLKIGSIILQPPALVLLITIIYIIIYGLNLPYPLTMYIVELCVLVIVNITKNIIVDRKKAQTDEAINKRTVCVYRGDQIYENMQWGQVRKGDIVRLDQGNAAPADIILLDSQQIHLKQAITHVDMKNVSGELEPQKKKACYLTQIINRSASQKLFWNAYRNIISGRIKFQKSTADMRNFNGYLKVTKDPKLQKLSIQNLILRQSIIKTSLWVYGLVIYPGMQSKIMKNFKQGNKNRQSIFSLLDKIFFVFLGINILLGTIFSISYHFFGHTLSIPYFGISYHFFVFSALIPNMLYLGRDIFQILFSLNSISDGIQVRNYSNLQSLGGIDLAMISNVGVLNPGKLYIDQIVTQSSIYEIKDQSVAQVANTIKNQKKETNKKSYKRRLGSSIKQGDLLANNINLLSPICNYDKKNSALVYKAKEDIRQESNFQIDDDSNFRNRHLPPVSRPSKLSTHLQPLKLSKQRFFNDAKRKQKQVQEYLKAISLCHQAKFYYNSNDLVFNGATPIGSEQIMFNLLQYVGWSIQPINQDKNEIGLNILETKEKMDDQTGLLYSDRGRKSFIWVGIDHFNSNRKLYSVVVTEKETQNTIMYCKGTPQAILQRIKMTKQAQKTIENAVSVFKQKQTQIIIYAKRVFSNYEKGQYENDYLSLKSSLTVTEQQIDNFSKKYQTNLEFISLVGMSSKIDPKAQSMIKQLRNSDIKPCIFVKQSSNVNNLKRLILNGEIYKDVCLEHQSIQQIKYYLNEVTNMLHLNPQLAYILTVSGSAWRTINSSSEVMKHFLFVAYYAKTILAFKFLPEQSAQLTKKFRYSYIEEQKVMGIGSCFTDLKFLGQSHISIGMQSDLPTDMKANNLSKISDALQLGPYFMQARLVNLNIVFYKIIQYASIVLVLEILYNAGGTSGTINGLIAFFYIVILNFIEIAYYIYHFRTPDILQNLQNSKSHKKSLTNFNFTCIQALIHGLIIVIGVYFTIPQIRYSNGKIPPKQALDMAIIVILTIVFVSRNFLSCYYSKIQATVVGVITLITFTLFTLISAYVSPEFERIALQIKQIFNSYDLIVLIVNISIFCILLSLFIQEILKKNYIFRKNLINKISNKPEKLEQMIELIKYLYKDQENIQESMKLIVEADLNVNEMKINKTLVIKNEEDDLKFNFYKVPQAKSILFKISVVHLINLSCYLIADIVGSQNEFEQYKSTLICAIIITILTIILTSNLYQMKMCYYKITGTVLFLNTCLIVGYALTKNDSSSYTLICFISVLLTQPIAFYFPFLLGLTITICLVSIIVSFVLCEDYVEISIRSIFLICCFVINMIVVYKSELDTKINFIINETFQKQANYISDILSILVPKFIKNHLQQKHFALQQQQQKVSILFCYICHFDQIVKQQGKNVVPFLDQIFRQFDQLCHSFAVQKIETVGQTYMAATGIQPYQKQIQTEMKKKNQVQRLLKMATQMQEKSEAIMWGTKKNKKLKIKIGIHHGSVVIGVIGYHKPQFSLIGDTVNQTSRHCSTADPGQIILSEVAYKYLPKYPLSAFDKKIRQMKGLNKVPVYAYKNAKIKTVNLNNKALIRFQQCVKIVIEELRKNGKIKKRNYKALDLCKQFVLQRRRSTIRKTKIEECNRSIEHEQVQIQDEKQNIYSDLQLKYNSALELKEKNSQFNKYLIIKNTNRDRIFLSVLALAYLLLFVVFTATGQYTILTIIYMSISLLTFIFLIIIYKKALKSRVFNILYFLLQVLIYISIPTKQIVIYQLNGDKKFISLVYLWTIFHVTICSSQVAFRFIHTFTFCMVCIISNCVLLGVINQFDVALIVEFFYFVLICFRKYSTLEQVYKNYSSSKIHSKKSKQQSDLVSQLLPKHAYEKLKNQNSENRLQLTDRFEKVTMLFADIKGFTSYSNQTTPVGVVKMLRTLFQQFDKLCLKYNVYKVYTIGDCYVVLGFTNCYQRDYYQQAKNVVNMGLAMIEAIQRVRQKIGYDGLDMRIGIHTGTIIGGIIGTQIVRYDIYGPDVMIANKFEQFGKTGAIHISEPTKQILDKDNKSFTITFEKPVKIEKLNAQINGYILNKKKFEI